MADAGSIGVSTGPYLATAAVTVPGWVTTVTTKRFDKTLAARHLPAWLGDQSQYLTTPNNGVISGVVKVAGTPEPYAIVSLYYKDSSNLIYRIRADGSGAFSFPHLNPSDNKYNIVAYPPSSAYNAITLDRLTPV